MALTSSGQLKLSEIAAEYGGSAPHTLSEYYGSDTVPMQGQISVSDFHGTSNITFISASGGSVSTSGSYKYHLFTGSANFTVASTSNTYNTLEYVVVAGGGSGGRGNKCGGSGGAGGYRTSSAASSTVVTMNTPYILRALEALEAVVVVQIIILVVQIIMGAEFLVKVIEAVTDMVFVVDTLEERAVVQVV
jgi:hypothetical protein